MNHIKIYLDNAATTPVDKRVFEEMVPYLTEIFGNPSSVHLFGRESKKAVEKARSSVAELINADPEEIVFTSGGTESDNAVLKSTAFTCKEKGGHIITTAIEHHAILHTCEFLERNGYKITYLPVDKSGIIDLSQLENAITDKTILISVMHANNEIGTIQPIEEIGQIAKKHNILFHTDAVQTIGHLPVDVKRMNIDFLSLSAHKLYGPKGTGALYTKSGAPFEPFIHGGAQENKRRASTLNVSGIAGLGKAAEIAQKEYEEEINTRKREIYTLEKEYNERVIKLDNRLENLDKKEEKLQEFEKANKDKEIELASKKEELNELIEQQNTKLSEIARLSRDEAIQILKNNLKNKARNEAAIEIRRIADNTKAEADQLVAGILSTAIQRVAVDYVSESTVSVVSLPDDEMKGRIIGREGRNIRAFEQASGIDLIIDDTPGAVVLSGFDPVRREIARLALEKLITDGRIHPGRIEQVIEKIARSISSTVTEICLRH